MTDLEPFKPPFPANGYLLRVELRDGEPWFHAKDVCGMLGITNMSMALRRLDSDQVVDHEISPADTMIIKLISESGLYSLIMRSEKREAHLFRRWVTSEVLPSIRKTGGYGVQRALSPRELAQLVIEAEDRADAARGELEAAKPAIEAHAAYLDANGTMTMATAAQTLGLGQNRLFAELRRHKVLISLASERYNTPYQKYADMGWFEIKQGTRQRTNGDLDATWTTRVTPKGLEGIRKLLAAE
jgi:prophage antirepressor-like protein